MANMYANNSQAIQRRRRLTNTAADLSGLSVPGLATPPTGALARASNEMAQRGQDLYGRDQKWRLALYQAGLDAAAKADDMDYRNAQLEQARQNAQMQDMATRRGQDYASREAALNRRQGLKREQMGNDAALKRTAMDNASRSAIERAKMEQNQNQFDDELGYRYDQLQAIKEDRKSRIEAGASKAKQDYDRAMTVEGYRRLQDIMDLEDEDAKAQEYSAWVQTFGDYVDAVGAMSNVQQMPQINWGDIEQ